MAMRSFLLASTTLTGLVAMLPAASAADLLGVPPVVVAAPTLPAVSAPNFKLGAFAGDFDREFGYGVTGAFSLPLSHDWGLQIDGMVGGADSALFYGVGGHLFWRDPSRGLIGAYGSYVGWDSENTISVADPIGGIADISGANVGKAGLEIEGYFNRISLTGFAGYQFGTLDGFAGRAGVSLYATDNLRLDLGVHYLRGPGTVGTLGLEWQPSAMNVSFFANGGVGADSYSYALGGIKLHLGVPAKTLIRRDREDDPQVTLPDDLFTAIGSAHCPAGTELIGGFCDGNL
jgi:hypothetical protein